MQNEMTKMIGMYLTDKTAIVSKTKFEKGMGLLSHGVSYMVPSVVEEYTIDKRGDKLTYRYHIYYDHGLHRHEIHSVRRIDKNEQVVFDALRAIDGYVPAYVRRELNTVVRHQAILKGFKSLMRRMKTN